MAQNGKTQTKGRNRLAPVPVGAAQWVLCALTCSSVFLVGFALLIESTGRHLVAIGLGFLLIILAASYVATVILTLAGWILTERFPIRGLVALAVATLLFWRIANYMLVRQ